MKDFIVIAMIAGSLIGFVASQADFMCPDNINAIYELPECEHVHTCCSSYYVCNQGTAYLLNCTTPGFVFNPDTSSCVDPKDCTETPYECPPGVVGFFPDQDCPKTKCCTTYEVCLDGVNYADECKNGTAFDVSESTCLSADVCFACPTDTFTGFLPDPVCPISSGTCCNDYKQCVDGVAYSINCASNLVYDPRTNRCVPNGVGNCQIN